MEEMSVVCFQTTLINDNIIAHHVNIRGGNVNKIIATGHNYESSMGHDQFRCRIEGRTLQHYTISYSLFTHSPEPQCSLLMAYTFPYGTYS